MIQKTKWRIFSREKIPETLYNQTCIIIRGKMKVIHDESMPLFASLYKSWALHCIFKPAHAVTSIQQSPVLNGISS
jgi:hypothetical protein